MFALTTRFMLSLLGTGILEGEGRHRHMTSPPAGCQVSSELPWGVGVGVTVRALPFVTGEETPQTPSRRERHDG